LCGHLDDVDDIVREAFLQAIAGLGRLRDPDLRTAALVPHQCYQDAGHEQAYRRSVAADDRCQSLPGLMG
jgi:hypothetical protein